MNKKFPRISIITPSFNQGEFIGETLRSVVNQNYPDLELIVMDGGSTDQTVSVLKQFADQNASNTSLRFIWKSEHDGGQAAAINKGLKIATGDILAYLNSDDTYEHQTLKFIGQYFQNHPKVQFVYGHGKLIDQKGKFIGMYNDFQVNFTVLHGSCPISQPTAFWTRKVLDKIGFFDASFNYTMDYEYWVRVSKKFRMIYLPEVLASTRIHPAAKTSSQTQKLYRDAIRVQKKYYKTVHHDWIFTYVDGQVHQLKNGRLFQEMYYWLYLFLISFWLQILWNHSPPTAAMFIQYWKWCKEVAQRTIARYKAI